MAFSNRTRWMTEPNRLARTLAALRKKGIPFLDLTDSNPTRQGFKYLESGILNPFSDSKNLLYDPDPHGLPRTRKAICDYYKTKGISLEPGQIFLTASTSEAYSFIFRLLADPGDLILAPQPSYPLLDYLTDLNDLEVGRYALRYDGAWSIDVGSMQALLKKRPKAVLFVHPNNPTGNYVHEEEKKNLLKFMPPETALLADEVFLDFAFEPKATRVPSFTENSSHLTFTLAGISKILGLPQMKLSWIVVSGPESLKIQAIERLNIISDTFLSASTPVQNALPRWFEMRPLIQKEILGRVQSNYRSLQETLRSAQTIKLLSQEGGWNAVMEFPSLKSDEDWALFLLEKRRLNLHPGYLFDFPQGSFLIASLLIPPETFQKAASILTQ